MHALHVFVTTVYCRRIFPFSQAREEKMSAGGSEMPLSPHRTAYQALLLKICCRGRGGDPGRGLFGDVSGYTVVGEPGEGGREENGVRPSGWCWPGLDWAGLAGRRRGRGGRNGEVSQEHEVLVPVRWTGLASVEVRRMVHLRWRFR